MHSDSFSVNRPEVIDEHFEDEYVIVNLKTGTYYSLNPSGARIWDALNQRASRAAILQEMERQYDTGAETLAAHLDRLLAEMVQEHLIVPQGDNGSAQTLTPDHRVGERLAFAPPHLEKFTDMQALLLLDPIHQVDESGWPAAKPNVA